MALLRALRELAALQTRREGRAVAVARVDVCGVEARAFASGGALRLLHQFRQRLAEVLQPETASWRKVV